MLKKFIFVMVISLLAWNISPNSVLGADFNPSDKGYKSDEILVKFKNSPKVQKVELVPGESVGKKIEEYEGRQDVEYAEPNNIVKTEAVDLNDPFLGKQWYLDKIKAKDAWARSSGSSGVVIAVLDTGVDIDHQDLADNIWVNRGEIPSDGIDNDGDIYVDDVYGWDFVAGDNDPRPDFKEWYFTREGINHGTIIAGIAAAIGNNARGIAGVAWQSKIMPVRVLDSSGSGDVLTVAEGIDYAVEKGADVINLSFIGSGFSKTLFLALERAYKAGVVVVAAVGNQGGIGKDLDVEPLYPVCYYGGEGENVVLGVAATDKDDKKTLFSNYGAKCVDISAPGVDFWSTQAYNPGEEGFEDYYGGGWSGSSVAAPLVSGAAALIKSVNPSLGVQEIRNLLVVNADNIDSQNPDYRGKLGGRLNLARATEAAALTVEGTQFTLRKGDILVSPVSGFKPEIKIFKEDSTFVKSFLAYNEKFLGGVSLASADVNGDGAGEIISGAGPGGGPHVRIFQQDGTPIGGFMAYTSTFRGGVNVAAGDIDGDGRADIIAAPASGLDPIVKVFDSRGNLKTQFLAFDKDFLGGIKVAAGDIDGDKIAEIAASKTSGGGEVRIFGQYLTLKLQFTAYGNFKGGVNVTLGDLDGDRVSEIITGTGPGGGPHVKVYNNKGILRSEFFAFGQDFRGGITVGVIR